MKTASLKQIEVVAGLICRDGRVLACQRDENGPFPLKWEFPGGKVENTESCDEALRRELKEELGIEPREFNQVYQNEHVYPDGLRVRLYFYRVSRYEGEMGNFVFHRIRWVQPSELAGLDFLDGDRPLVAELVASAGSGLLW